MAKYLNEKLNKQALEFAVTLKKEYKAEEELVRQYDKLRDKLLKSYNITMVRCYYRNGEFKIGIYSDTSSRHFSIKGEYNNSKEFYLKELETLKPHIKEYMNKDAESYSSYKKYNDKKSVLENVSKYHGFTAYAFGDRIYTTFNEKMQKEVSAKLKVWMDENAPNGFKYFNTHYKGRSTWGAKNWKTYVQTWISIQPDYARESTEKHCVTESLSFFKEYNSDNRKDIWITLAVNQDMKALAKKFNTPTSELVILPRRKSATMYGGYTHRYINKKGIVKEHLYVRWNNEVPEDRWDEKFEKQFQNHAVNYVKWARAILKAKFKEDMEYKTGKGFVKSSKDKDRGGNRIFTYSKDHPMYKLLARQKKLNKWYAQKAYDTLKELFYDDDMQLDINETLQSEMVHKLTKMIHKIKNTDTTSNEALVKEIEANMRSWDYE